MANAQASAFQPGTIKSIQRAYVQGTVGSTTWDTTIAAVDVNKSVIVPLGYSGQGGGGTNYFGVTGMFQFISATVVRYTFPPGTTGTGGNQLLSFEVVEYY